MNEDTTTFRTRTFVCADARGAIAEATRLILDHKNFRIEMIEAGWKFIVREPRP